MISWDKFVILVQLFVAACSPARDPDANSDYMTWGHSSLVGPVCHLIERCALSKYNSKKMHFGYVYYDLLLLWIIFIVVWRNNSNNCAWRGCCHWWDRLFHCSNSKVLVFLNLSSKFSTQVMIIFLCLKMYESWMYRENLPLERQKRGDIYQVIDTNRE